MNREQLVKTSWRPDTYLQCHVKPGRSVELFQVKKFEVADHGKWFTGTVHNYAETNFGNDHRYVAFVYKNNTYFFEGLLSDDLTRLTMLIKHDWRGRDSFIKIYDYDEQGRLKVEYSGTVRPDLKSGFLDRKIKYIYDPVYPGLFDWEVTNNLNLLISEVTDNLYYLSQM